MDQSIILVTAGIAAAAAIVGGIGLSGLRAAQRGRVEQRLQTVFDAFAEREIAREKIRRDRRHTRRPTPHGTILQLQ